MFKLWRFSGLCIAVSLSVAVDAGAWGHQAGGAASASRAQTLAATAIRASQASSYPVPDSLGPPTYDYSEPNACPMCHFALGYDQMARAAGVGLNASSGAWQFSGSGWFAAWHSQSDHGANENTFCAKCHSPLQASATASFNGGFINADPIPQGRFAAVTCGVCHPPDAVVTVLAARNPNAILDGALASYQWKGYNNPASYKAILPGQEDTLCLNCHEERHSQTNAAFEAMYSAGVRCIDCHMAPYQVFTGTSTLPAPALTERFHDWKVAANEPYSCGAQGSLAGFGCHAEFTGTDAQQFIPFLMQQHSDWWALPPFNGSQVAVSAHGVMTASKYRTLWKEIAQIDSEKIQ